ncbi:MAG: hypothetical protein PWP71_520 [Clostridia bacterium]|nr:hypothetical protein [Clostridia bacterium]
MSRIRTGMRMLYSTSFLGLIAIGGLLALTLTPIAKKALRRVAVLTTKSILTVSQTSNNVLNNFRSNISNIVEETNVKPKNEEIKNLKNKVRVRKRALAVGAVKANAKKSRFPGK